MAKQVTEDGNSYQKYTVQLTREISTRAGNTPTKDEDFVNCLFELVKDKASHDQRDFILKRCGTADFIASQTSNEVRGMFYWEDQYKLFYAAAGNIYIWDFNTATLITLAAVFTTTSGKVGFTEYLYDTNQVVVMATDGTKLVRIDSSNVLTTCVDADLPTPHLPYPVFLDGYLLLVKSGTSDIYNSDLNDPMAWTPGNFISAEMQPDLLVGLAKVNNYVVALGSESVEYFWDAGNASGSPLSRNDSPIKINTFLGGLSQYGNDVFYVGKSVGGQFGVYMLKDFKVEEISTPSVVRYLNTVTELTSGWKTAIIAIQGHTVLLVSIGTLSFVYDLENKLWGRWSYQSLDNFPIVYSARVTTTTSRYTMFAFKGADSKIMFFDDPLMQDSSTNYPVQVITEQANFGTLNRKTMARFALYADRTPSDSNILVYWTDNDFQSYNGPRYINMNQDLQSTYILGSFRQRAFKLVYTGPSLLRLQSIEVDINKGIS